MRQKAIDEARVRLERVRAAANELDNPTRTKTSIQTAWWSFLLAAGGIYSKLEQGAKGHGQSESWFGRRKHERKKDELLSYIHHARNSDEHSIEGSANEHGVYVTPGNKWTKVQSDGTISIPSGKPLALRLHEPGMHLIPVHDTRYGDTFHPPQRHLGKPLSEVSILGLVRDAELYLSQMIEEAAKLPAHL